MSNPRDTTTKRDGIFARHKLACALTPDKTAECNCKPGYYGVAWDRDRRRPVKTRTYPTISAAVHALVDLKAALRSGTYRTQAKSDLTLGDVIDRFLDDATAGVARNKRGRVYTPNSVANLRSSFTHVPDRLTRRALTEISLGDMQGLVDRLSVTRKVDGEDLPALSSSRIKSVVNSVRVLYRYAGRRELCPRDFDPTDGVLLPVDDSTPRDRVVSPSEFLDLMDPLEALDRLPFEVAVYTSARAAEVRQLDWSDIDWEGRIVLLAGDHGKTRAAKRVVPILSPLYMSLRAEWDRQGRPATGRVCRPRRHSKSGELSTGQLLKRAYKTWDKKNLIRINLHECRHTCGTWLDHAGVSPKVASVWMGHQIPERQPGAARITLERYTHVLAGELEVAREIMETFIATRTAPARERVGA